MLRTTSAEWTPWAIASAQAASTAGSPSVSTAVRISTICRLPSSAPASLRRTPRIDPHEQHAAVTKPDMGGLHDDRHPAQQDDLVAPIKLVGFPRREAQRDVGRRRRLPALLAPSPGVAPHGIVAAVVAAPA